MSNITLASGATQSTKDATAVVTLSSPPAAGSVLRFSLVVVDNLGNSSQPAFVDVTVQGLPVAVLKSATAVSAGATITLDGSGSTPQNNLTSYQWELVSASNPVVTPPPIVITPPIVTTPPVLKPVVPVSPVLSGNDVPVTPSTDDSKKTKG